jgi:hypothetical protein
LERPGTGADTCHGAGRAAGTVGELPGAEPRESLAAGPRSEYLARREARRATAARQARLHQHIANARFAAFAAAAALAWLSFWAGHLSAWWLAAPVALFVLLIVLHARVARVRKRAERAAEFYDKGLARLDDHWAGTGEPGNRYLDPNHPCASDLDLFGSGSIFERLCTARTRVGEDALAGWLLSPAPAADLPDRQDAVAELRPLLDLREDLALLGDAVPSGIDREALAKWGAAPPVLVAPRVRLAALLLSGLTLAAVIAALARVIGLLPVLAAFLAEGALALWLRVRVQRVIGPVGKMAHDLAVFAGVLGRIEGEHFTSPRLRQLAKDLVSAGEPPSRRIARLGRFIDLLDSKQNQLFAPVAVILMWDTQIAFAIEAWRRASGPAVGRWLGAVGEFEALASLAAYAYENPADPFPEVVAAGPCFDGEGLGHPLIPEARCVRNDVHLTGELSLLVISGSNMSGKSTLLRTVGVNAVLALAGAPVRARRLRVSPLAVGATLRVQDSLQENRSRFFAEITRIRQLVDLARGPVPLLFLLDEIFGGTNSHDRRLGAEAVVRGLVDAGAIGLVTTHDLALTHIVDLLAGRAANVHFEDHFENGTITFDYRMRPGVVRKSNALALMRAVGLEV